MENTPQERRKSKRYYREMAGNWHRFGGASPQGEAQWVPTFVHNISRGGLCFDLAEPVELAQQVQFKTQVDATMAPIRCKGAVVRLRPLGNRYTEVGVCFTVIDDKDADFVDVLAWGQNS